jgi:hypothetical protein
MAASYHYFGGAGGLRVCYAAEPTYRCPLVPEDEPKLLLPAAAKMLGCELAKLERLFARGHQRALRERDDEGKFTGRCAACGAPLEKVGFAAWKERTVTEPTNSGQTIAVRLFGGATEQLGPRRYFDRKKEAIEWCREEAKISLAQAAEAAGANPEL